MTADEPSVLSAIPSLRDNAAEAEDDRGLLQIHVLVDIGNYRELRRRLGCGSAATLIGRVAERVKSLLPTARVEQVGTSTVSCSLCGNDIGELDRHIALLQAAFDQPLRIDDQSIVIVPAFGGATAAIADLDEVAMVERAEAALEEARVIHRAVVHEVEPRTRADTLRLARELDLAIDRNELLLLYQPKVHVRRQEVNSAEALIRWRHPERGMVMPNDFIAVAEECHLVDRMTLWVIRQAIRDQRGFAAGGHDIRLFINISGQLLADTRFVREACALVAGSDAKLGFEITETSVIRDPQSAIANLQIFADFGITISIDDYGAGLSSLAYLKQLPARELKIDKMFVTQLTSSNRDPLIVRSTIDLAHALEMEVVAEGVETRAALALLSVMGCDMVQGFLLSRPITASALMDYLDEGAHLASGPTPRVAFDGFVPLRKQA